MDVQAHAHAIGVIHDQYLQPLANKLPQVPPSQLGLLIALLRTTSFYAPLSGHGGPPRAAVMSASVLNELDQRATAKDVEGVHNALVRERQFASAESIRQAHPNQGLPASPRIIAPQPLNAARPAAFEVNADGTLRLDNLRLDGEWRLIAVGVCHFAEDAARAIAQHPGMSRAFAEGRAQWIAGVHEPIEAMAQWNTQFPQQPLALAYENTAWAPVSFGASPTFFLFRDGRLVATHQGWSRDGSDMRTLEAWLDTPD